jgi:hypothetical protein
MAYKGFQYTFQPMLDCADAVIEQDPFTRPQRLSESLRLCRKSVDTFPTASGYYHLALALSYAGTSRDINQAIENARSAVEEDHKEIKHWHLLGVLLVTTDDWKKAQGVLEYGAAIGEDQDSDGMGSKTPNTARNDSSTTIEGLPTVDDSSPFKSPPLLARDSLQIPSSHTLLQALPDHPPPSQRELFEQALQLRMTQLALTEYVEGPEGAVEKWLEVFYWVSEQKDLTGEGCTHLCLTHCSSK